ncbi:MAG: ROK family protein [Gemmataceae bacterium]|nr:ROK family protein [Gemmataceae bacterium]
MFLGIEIGGTKLQLGLGPADGKLRALWRDKVDPARGAEGIREQIERGIPVLLKQAGLSRGELKGVGIGFGGPVDDATKTVIRSHQIAGWDGFPLADWISDVTGLPAVLGNDAAVAGLAEAWHGAGKGVSPLFYMTIGSGIGGCLIIDGEMYRGCGRGAGEIGQIVSNIGRDMGGFRMTLEMLASGWEIGERFNPIFRHRRSDRQKYTAKQVAGLAEEGDAEALQYLESVARILAEALTTLITLLCPRRIVIGGGVSLMGEELLFAPLRRMVAERTFEPFAGLTDIVPAALGEEVVVHGAVELARKRLGGRP